MFSFTLDHAAYATFLTDLWTLINWNGIAEGVLNLVCAVAIFNVIRHLGDDDREIDTSEGDIEMGSDAGAFEQ